MTRPHSISSDNASDSGHPTPSTSLAATPRGQRSSRQTSPSPLRIASLPPQARNSSHEDSLKKDTKYNAHREDSRKPSDDLDVYEMHPMSDQPAGGHSHVPLLSDDKYHRRSHGSGDRPFLTSRGSHLHARTPNYPQPEDQTRKKYIYASLCLLVALISFVVQTETSVYIQHELKWNKAYCMLWLTHGSWVALWPVQLLFLRIAKRKQSWPAFWRRHKALLRSTAQMVRNQDLNLTTTDASRTPWPYIIKTTAYVTTFLTFAGASWYIAIDMTSPSDLTAIYNCSAFFAYVFSIILLKDKLRLDKIMSVGLAIIGVLVVAYGDKDDPDSHPKTGGHSGGGTNPNPDGPPNNRLLGNLVIGIGSVLYGLYEVLYKKYACPPEGTSPSRGVIFANTFGSCIGLFTLTVLWIPLPILHYTGLETFELPRGQTAWLLAISTLTNATFSGSFLVLMSLTSPVLSSVAALLTIFLVAITDWLLTGKQLSTAAIAGGMLIVVAFLMLSWATYREMKEEAVQREIRQEDKIVSDEDDEDESAIGGLHGEDAALVDDDELDVERSGKKHNRRRSSIVIRGDQSESDDQDDSGVLETAFHKTRRHRES